MKFDVELSFIQRSRFKTCVEAESLEDAKAQVYTINEADIPAWDSFDRHDRLWSVTPSVEPLSTGCRVSNATEAANPPTDVQAAFRRVVDYLYDDEAEDYQTMSGLEQRGHMFEAVLLLARWLARFEQS